MLRLESAMPATVATPSTPATAGGASGGFGATYARLHADIDDSVRNGFAPAATVQATMLPAGVLGPALAPPASGSADAAQRHDFLTRIAPWADQAAAQLGISSDLVAAHAALESGWGLHPPSNGQVSGHNLFGLKAGADWRGASTDTATHEFLGGAMQQMVQRFRAYGDEASAFLDYARLLQAPRYAGTRNLGDDADAFARALVHGGYATDPHYAQKLLQVVDTVRGMRQR
ncbi:glucosaminidase domain-containing protein [Xanthomonas campestris pv. phormiicola]|nr:glucosaminidase domain-containing protein [Xanthomonas campestris pv. phormiicola]UYC17862.1 glucosaminidase domain-containing protein [Xanthomonas campestris pv. phormiicola]